MKDLGIYLIILSIPFFLLYLVSVIFLYPDGHAFLNLHILAIAHVLNAATVYFLWTRFYEKEDQEEVLDEHLLLAKFSADGQLHPVLPNFLFPFGFLISIGTLTYMVMYILDHSQYGFSHWFGEELLVTFLLACSIPSSLISVPFYIRLMSNGLTQNR